MLQALQERLASNRASSSSAGVGGQGQAAQEAAGSMPIMFAYSVVGGSIPPARWSHAAVAAGSQMYLYGETPM
jgi:hypothetical protein